MWARSQLCRSRSKICVSGDANVAERTANLFLGLIFAYLFWGHCIGHYIFCRFLVQLSTSIKSHAIKSCQREVAPYRRTLYWKTLLVSRFMCAERRKNSMIHVLGTRIIAECTRRIVSEKGFLSHKVARACACAHFFHSFCNDALKSNWAIYKLCAQYFTLDSSNLYSRVWMHKPLIWCAWFWSCRVSLFLVVRIPR